MLQVVIVTGSDTGIGRQTAEALVTRGAHVILACINTVGAEKAAEVCPLEHVLFECAVSALKQCSIAAACPEQLKSPGPHTSMPNLNHISQPA